VSDTIVYVRDVEEVEQNIPISINPPVRAFDCPLSFLKLALEDDLEPPGNRGKHAALDHDREQ
jgi:hypothetical protein